MDGFLSGLIKLIHSYPGTLEVALIYSIMVMGVYITYKVLDFPDLSVDGTFPLGGFIFAAFATSIGGFYGIKNPVVGLVMALIAGGIAGFLTGFLHVKFKIPNLLSGILVMTGLYSINSRVVGVPNIYIPAERSIYQAFTYEKHFILLTLFCILLIVLKSVYDYKIKENKYVIKSILIYLVILVLLITYTITTKKITLYLTSVIVFFIKMVIDYILTSKFGFALRALGDNENLVVSLGVDEKKLKIFGLMLSNALVALSGALFAQYLKVADITTGVGTIVIGLAAIIFGSKLIEKSKLINDMSIVVIGSIMYYSIVFIALESNRWTKKIYTSIHLPEYWIKQLEVRPTDVKIITVTILVVVMVASNRKKIKNSSRIKSILSKINKNAVKTKVGVE